MRSRTIRFASAVLAALSTVIPFRSSAALARLTRAGSARVANRRATSASISGRSSATIVLLSAATLIYLLLQTLYRQLVAYASIFAHRPRCPCRPARGRPPARRAGNRGLAVAAPGACDAHAPARDRA